MLNVNGFGGLRRCAGLGTVDLGLTDIASKRLRVLHIRLNLPENRARLGAPTKQEFENGKRGSTHVDLF